MSPYDPTSSRFVRRRADGRPSEPILASPIGPPRSDREARFRRRRAGAVLVAIAALVAVGMAFAGGGAGAPASRSAAISANSPFPLSRHRIDTGAAGTLALGGVTPAETAAIDRALRYTNYLSEGSRGKPEVALTFDDGPGPFTPQVLAVLQRERVPATFFQVGQSIHDYGSYAQQELGAGFPIEDHTQTHPLLGRLSAADQQTEVSLAAQAIQSYGAPYPRLFRPPFGSFDHFTVTLLREQRMLMVLWSVDTRDFSQPGVDAIVMTALQGAKPGAIILMHDAGGPRSQTVAALPLIIRGLRRRGLQLVTVPRLILDDPPVPGQPPPRNLSGQ